MILRPGPESIDPALAPGGLVIHIYDRAGRLLLEQMLVSDEDCDSAEQHAHAVLAAGPPFGEICFVVFDGDTGHRIAIAP